MRSLLWYSWRSWKNAKSVGALAIVALAVGIGCATAIFTVVDAVFFKPLPYAQGDRWIALFGASTVGSERDKYSALSYADLIDYQQRTRSFDVFGWYTIGGDFNVTSPGQPQHIEGIEVTPSLIDNVGIAPIRGRLFHPSDGPNVALLSSGLWNRLGSDPSILGRPITLNSESYTVVGIMPSWFRLPVVSVSNQETRNDVWLPAKLPHDEAHRRNNAMYAAYARRKPGVSLEQARTDVQRVASEIAKESPGNHQAYTAALFGLREFVIKDIRPVLFLLFGAAGLLLLITCANVAGLLVTRSVGRVREIAIRIALGGNRRQLALQFFLEGLLISTAAAVLGILASLALLRLVVSLAAEYIPRADEVSINWAVVLFAILVACLAAILSAMAPLWHAMHTQPNEVLGEGTRASAGARSRKLSRSLVVAEIALAFTILSAGALLISQLQNLNRTSPGFDPNRLLTFQLNLAGARLPAKELPAYQERLLQAFASVPGVSSVALANQVPLAGCCLGFTLFPDRQNIDPEVIRPVSMMIVSPSYFQTMRIPLRRGRLLNEHDISDNIVPVVIDESAAKRFWPKQDPLGASAHAGTPDGSRLQVVGVVGDVRNEGLGATPRPEVYLVNALSPVNPMHFIVRSPLPPASLVPALRHALQKIDPTQPIYAVQSMREIVAGSLTLEHLDSVVIGFFACAALLMASLGIYGVTSYSVRERTVEIGTRMALGATGRDLLRLILGSGLSMAVAGLLLGAAAVAGVSFLASRFFNVHDISPLPYLYSIAIIMSVALFASFVPAWRATLLSPIVAIRNDSDSVWTAARRSVQQALGIAPSAVDSPAFNASLLTDVTEASRRADSFPEVLRTALASLREKLQSQSVMLLAHSSDTSFQSLAASPEPLLTPLKVPENGFVLNRLKFYHAALAFAPGDLDTAHRWASQQKPEHLPEIESLMQAGVQLAVALRSRSEIIGLLLLGPPLGRTAYSSGDRQLMAACAGQFALIIENAHLTDRVLEQETLRRDLALAAEVQRRLLPQKPPASGAASWGAFSLPARSVGGDYYDFVNIGDHGIGIALADVAGKGIAAALIMAVVHASLRIIAAEGNISLPQLAARMNSFLHRSTGANSYATFFYAQLDNQNRQLRYVNAGHNPPYLVRALNVSSSPGATGATVEELTTGGMIIGMFPVASYEDATVSLNSGDLLLAFTDGVTEALNAVEEEFGEERLKHLVRDLAHLPVEDITARISQELRRWIGEAPQHDDLTFVVMKVN